VCFYCEQILTGQFAVPVVYESEQVLAFRHTQPYFETHIVIISKTHVASVSDAAVLEPQLALAMVTALQRLTSQVEAEFGGCTLSTGTGGYQKSEHLHWFIFAGQRLRADRWSPIDVQRD